MDKPKDIFADNKLTREACFSMFDKNRDNKLDENEFKDLCSRIFVDENGSSYNIDPARLEEMFKIFDKNADGFIDNSEFELCWDKWIQTIVHPVSAIVVVDVQNDFITGTLSLSQCPAHEDGAEVVEPINDLVATVNFDLIVYTLDWHPENHISFYENRHLRPFDPSSPVSAENAKEQDKVVFAGPPRTEMILWPKHAVQNTWGAELHKDLKIPPQAIKVYKGTNPEVDSFSAFFDNSKINQTTLSADLRSKNITDVYLCGLAFDICVGCSVLDSLKLGFRTILVEDCTRKIDACRKDAMRESIIENLGLVIPYKKVKAMTEGKDRNPLLGYKLALELRKTN